MAEGYYILPSSSTVLCEDRFSITDSDELLVPFWAVLTTLLNTTKVDSPAVLIDILETIAVVRRGRSDTDYGYLKEFLLALDRRQHFFAQVWPAIKDLALEMPTLFPGSMIPILGKEQASLVLSRRQVACLVVHQFLCTLTAPTWQDGFQDFHIWYSSEQPHAKAVEAYLAALFEYFFRLVDGEQRSPLASGIEEWPITYTLHRIQVPLFADASSTPLTDLQILSTLEASTSPSALGLPDGAAVISANKFIGFGRTGTQEETHVGASPECCPAVLVTPPLEDDQALVVTGPEAMITVSGYQRSARCGEILRPETADTPEDHRARWKHRTMLFMDALELDLYDRDAGLPDLQPGNVDRELRKAYTAFLSYKKSGRSAYSRIYTGYWGCGTFGGNPGVKSLIQWCAASLAGCDLTFVCSGEERRLFGEELESFVGIVKDKTSASDLVEIVRKLQPEDVSPGDSVLEMVKSKICN
jgi:poly(ADP-ribose) glycohydrolase